MIFSGFPVFSVGFVSFLIFATTGTIPRELGRMKALRNLNVDRNKFTSELWSKRSTVSGSLYQALDRRPC